MQMLRKAVDMEKILFTGTAFHAFHFKIDNCVISSVITRLPTIQCHILTN